MKKSNRIQANELCVMIGAILFVLGATLAIAGFFYLNQFTFSKTAGITGLIGFLTGITLIYIGEMLTDRQNKPPPLL